MSAPAPASRFPRRRLAAAGVLIVPARPGVVPSDLAAGDRVRVRGEVVRVAPDRDAGPELLREGGVLERFAGLPSIAAVRVERLV